MLCKQNLIFKKRKDKLEQNKTTIQKKTIPNY